MMITFVLDLFIYTIYDDVDINNYITNKINKYHIYYILECIIYTTNLINIRVFNV